MKYSRQYVKLKSNCEQISADGVVDAKQMQKTQMFHLLGRGQEFLNFWQSSVKMIN